MKRRGQEKSREGWIGRESFKDGKGEERGKMGKKRRRRCERI
jgi:hypothetical protein